MKNTNEKLLQEVGMIVLLFITILLLTNTISKCNRIQKQQPSIEDLHQQQEMIDYHRAQGREIIVH